MSIKICQEFQSQSNQIKTVKKPSTYGVVVSVTAHGERGPGFDPGQGRLSFLSEISLNSAMCFANNPFTCGRRCPNIPHMAEFLNLVRFSPSLCTICCVHGEQSSVGRMGTVLA